MWDWFLRNLSDIDSFVSICVAVIGVMVPIGGVVIGFVRIKLKHNQFKYLNLRMDEKQINQSLKCFIPTRVQDLDPFADGNSITLLTKEIIPFFINTVFKETETQYYLILAGSGMGKTTFMLKLFIQYYKKIFKKYKIFLISLNLNDSIERIKKIENQSNTILLLDGFDEDPVAMNDYKERLDTIYKGTELFHKIIITCRTQFFSNSKNIPKYTGGIRYGTGEKGIKIIRYYISPFNDSEINCYLRKKYNRVFEKDKIQSSQKLINNCPFLMMRPMLLSYIDDLVGNQTKEYNYTYEVYSELVSKWIERETIRTGINKELYKFSEKVAEFMFYNKRLYMNTNEIADLCEKYNIKLNRHETQSKSLLNRNADDIYDFAHKSILEYFLARKVCDDLEFRKKVSWRNLQGFDVFELFISEMCDHDLRIHKQENTKILKYSFEYLYLPKIKLKNRNINNHSFEGCYLKGADFSDSIIQDVNLKKANLENANLKKVILERVELDEARLQGANLSEITMLNVKLTNQSLVGVNLNGAVLRNSDLSNTDLREANLCNVDLMGTNLNNVDLRGANLSNSNLKNVNLMGAKLDEIHVSYIKKLYGFLNMVVMVSENETGKNVSMRI